jgi:hypothetical protein
MTDLTRHPTTELQAGWTQPNPDPMSQEASAMALLNYYSFDLNTGTSEQLVSQWSYHYSGRWIRSAVIEALYQGRYKAVSVEQILAFWDRRSQPLCHFNHEFERMICGHFIHNRGAKISPSAEAGWILPTDAEGSSSQLTQPLFPQVLEAKRQIEIPKMDIGSAISGDLPVLNPVSPSLTSLQPFQPHSLGNAEIQEIVTKAPQSEDETTLDLVPNPPHSDQQTNLEVPETVTSILLPARLAEPEPSHPSLASPLSEISFLEHPVPVFQPQIRLGAKSLELRGWSRIQAAKSPIHQFVPAFEPSVFYARLKAVAQALRASGE